MKKTYKIEGFSCPSCATMLEMDLEDAGIKAACSYAKEVIEIDGDHDVTKIEQIVIKSGYKLSE